MRKYDHGWYFYHLATWTFDSKNDVPGIRSNPHQVTRQTSLDSVRRENIETIVHVSACIVYSALIEHALNTRIRTTHTQSTYCTRLRAEKYTPPTRTTTNQTFDMMSNESARYVVQKVTNTERLFPQHMVAQILCEKNAANWYLAACIFKVFCSHSYSHQLAFGGWINNAFYSQSHSHSYSYSSYTCVRISC